MTPAGSLFVLILPRIGQKKEKKSRLTFKLEQNIYSNLVKHLDVILLIDKDAETLTSHLINNSTRTEPVARTPGRTVTSRSDVVSSMSSST